MDEPLKEEMPEWCSDTVLADFGEEIINCLVRYGLLTEAEARKQFNDSGICSAENNATEMSRLLLFHEYPYYGAMSIIHARTDPQWYQDPQLWPPPEDYVRKELEPLEAYIKKLESDRNQVEG